MNFQISKTGDQKKFIWTLYAANGATVAISPGRYASRPGCIRAIVNLIDNFDKGCVIYTDNDRTIEPYTGAKTND